MSNKNFNFAKDQGFSEVMNVSFNFFIRHIKPISILLFTYALIPMLITGFLGSFINQDNLANIIKTLSGSQTIQTPPGALQMVLFMLSYLITSVFITGLVIVYAKMYQDSDNETISLSDTWKYFLTEMPQLFLFQILLIVLVVFVMLAVILLVVILTQLSIALAVIGGIAAFVMFIYLMVPISLIYNVRIVEKKDFMESLKRCFALVKEHWWLTFGLIFIVSIIVNTVSFIFGLPQLFYTVAQGITSLQGAEVSPNSLLFFLFTMISYMGTFWLTSILTLSLFAHYFSLSEKKDKNSLIRRIDEINQSETYPSEQN